MEFELKDEYITLAQLLKACDVVYSGGQAKEYLANMEVLVNGVNENRRGKKIYHGDIENRLQSLKEVHIYDRSNCKYGSSPDRGVASDCYSKKVFRLGL